MTDKIDFRDKFKKFGGDFIPDIVEYLKSYINQDPGVTVTVGCDSIQLRRKTVYAMTIMLYNTDVRRGAHVVFFRLSCAKIRENQERLYKEAQYLHDLAVFLNDGLEPFYNRKDLNDIEKKKYKYHLAKCVGEYSHVPPHQEDGVIKNLTLTPADLMEPKLVDIHVDFNPYEGVNGQNKSHIAYKSFVPWLRGLGFRVWGKPLAHASTTAADLLLKG
jgi:predicted RNase H-related nuclease YkuK (DUF458 family)